MKINQFIKPEYLEQNNSNPKYIFHGSCNLIMTDIEPKKGHDEVGNSINEQKAIYGISLFKGAIPYAIGKGKVSCSIGYMENDLKMKIYNGIIPEDSYGYIYVFARKSFEQCNDSCQYVLFDKAEPIDIVQVQYRDFKDCFIDKTKYSLIDTPHELFSYMYFNIEYKWMDQLGTFHEELDPKMYTEFSLMSPREVIENKCGICVDQVELERDWFEKHNIYHEVLNIQIFRENTSPGHVFLIYNADNKWHWFENAWEEFVGIHTYLNRYAAIEDIKNKFIIQNQIKEYELPQLKIKEHIKYPFHSSYEDMDNYTPAKIK
ncbi:MAG: transglutaminase-like domain-containing protein [Bacilli bacterium]|nr:transglutaminase-like domain-containing protein [Bacilli bacterium]